MGRSAFTLIELLVVIVVITLLMSILLPALGKARGAAKAMICLSNQRQLAVATAGYLNDHHLYYPQPGQDADMDPIESGRSLWFNALDYYLGQQQKQYAHNVVEERNYSDFKQDPVWREWDAEQRAWTRTIRMNEFFGHPGVTSGPAGSWRFYREPDVARPSVTVLFADGRSIDTPSITGNIDTGSAGHFHVREVYVGLRHQGGANVAKVDGSARHHQNPVRVSPGGYSGWYDDDDPDPSLRPEVVFRFRPVR